MKHAVSEFVETIIAATAQIKYGGLTPEEFKPGSRGTDEVERNTRRRSFFGIRVTDGFYSAYSLR